MKNARFTKVWNDLLNTLEEGTVIYTLARKCPNEVTSIEADCIWVKTEKSSPASEPVPKWMFERAVTHLQENGTLTNSELLNSLNVKRSSFVMAALSRLEYIGHDTRPLRIFLR